MRGGWLITVGLVVALSGVVLWPSSVGTMAQRSVDEAVQRVRVDGSTVAYAVAGDEGTPVLLLAPEGATRDAWSLQVQSLRMRHRVLTVDPRGAGDSGPVGHGLSVDTMATDAETVLDHVGWPTVHVVGASMGGLVAQELALRNPERVRSLALIGTHAGGEVAPKPAGLAYALGRRYAVRFQWDGLAEELLARTLYSDGFLAEQDDRTRRALARVWGPAPRVETFDAQAAAVSAYDARGRLPRLAGIPTLILVTGEHDLIVPQSAQWDLAAQMPWARTVTVPSAGHGVIVERSGDVAFQLRKHLNLADGRVR